jgi:hypothetical protein
VSRSTLRDALRAVRRWRRSCGPTSLLAGSLSTGYLSSRADVTQIATHFAEDIDRDGIEAEDREGEDEATDDE